MSGTFENIQNNRPLRSLSHSIVKTCHSKLLQLVTMAASSIGELVALFRLIRELA